MGHQEGDWSSLGNRVGRGLPGAGSKALIRGTRAQEVGTLYFLVCLAKLKFMHVEYNYM